MKSSAKILLIASVLLALGELVFSTGLESIILAVIFGIFAIIDFVFMLEGKTNKKLLWIHIVPLMIIAGELLYNSIRAGFLNAFFGLSFLIAAYILSFCALLVHIDHSIKQQKIKDLEAEISRLKG